MTSITALDAFLAEPRNVIVAGIRKDGRPHVSPNWFFWDGERFYVSTTRPRVKYKIFSRDPRVELIIDDATGHRYAALSGTVDIREDVAANLHLFRAIGEKHGRPVPPDDTLAASLIAPRVGPRLMVPLGMAVTAVGMVVFAQLTVGSSYAGHVLPGLVIVGAGLGLVFGTAFNTATYRALPADAGVASAMVNVGQQVGGAIGTAMLNTLAASAVASYLSLRAPTALNAARAAVHGDVTAFWVTAAVLLGGAVITALLYRPGRVQAEAGAAPVAV